MGWILSGVIVQKQPANALKGAAMVVEMAGFWRLVVSDTMLL